MKLFVIAFLIAGLGQCSSSRADNVVNVDQVSQGTSVTITQEGAGHTATVNLGAISSVDYSLFTILQSGAAKTAFVEVKSGINNTMNIQQDGNGNHTASIQNFIGSGNQISISQQGSGNHSFTVSTWTNNVNNGNTVTATQSGGVGADKTFNLYFNGATGAGVTVTQTNPTTPDQAGMNIQCTTCGGSWSYIKY